MTKKNILIITLVLILGGLSLYFNTDWFSSEVIQVSHRSISPRGWMARGAALKTPANPVVFLINKNLKLTSVKVVVVSDAQTNKYPHAVWNLVSDSNSIPTKEFIYGAPIKGMRLAVQGVGADPLQPGLNYRLLIEADPGRFEHDFVPVPRTQ
jgi:hypothetical protein